MNHREDYGKFLINMFALCLNFDIYNSFSCEVDILSSSPNACSHKWGEISRFNIWSDNADSKKSR